METLKIFAAVGWALAIISPFVWRYIFNKWDADDDYEMGEHYAIYMKEGVVFDVSHTDYDDITKGEIYIEGIDSSKLDILYDLIKADLVEKVDE